jgi:hypothetical protein
MVSCEKDENDNTCGIESCRLKNEIHDLKNRVKKLQKKLKSSQQKKKPKGKHIGCSGK